MSTKTISVVRDLLATNKQAAAAIRQELRSRGILCVNLLSSPGSGKTTLLESLSGRFKDRYRMAGIEGDIETERGAERIRAQGGPAAQITKGGGARVGSTRREGRATRNSTLPRIGSITRRPGRPGPGTSTIA